MRPSAPARGAAERICRMLDVRQLHKRNDRARRFRPRAPLCAPLRPFARAPSAPLARSAVARPLPYARPLSRAPSADCAPLARPFALGSTLSAPTARRIARAPGILYFRCKIRELIHVGAYSPIAVCNRLPQGARSTAGNVSGNCQRNRSRVRQLPIPLAVSPDQTSAAARRPGCMLSSKWATIPSSTPGSVRFNER